MLELKEFNLIGKIAIITGGAGLLGSQHCLALLEMNCKVIACDISKLSLKNLKEMTQKKGFGQNLITYELDLTKELDILKLYDYVKLHFSKIDILINNAAINPAVSKDGFDLSGRLEDFKNNTYLEESAVGLTSYILFCKFFGKMMAKQNYGVIINIASDLSVIAPDQSLYKESEKELIDSSKKPISYSVIKHGIIGLTKYMASYYGHKGVRCNALSPGGVYVDQPKIFVENLVSKIPLQRMACPEEYKGAIKFLCSDASKYMTGQNLVIDGGRSVL